MLKSDTFTVNLSHSKKFFIYGLKYALMQIPKEFKASESRALCTSGRYLLNRFTLSSQNTYNLDIQDFSLLAMSVSLLSERYDLSRVSDIPFPSHEYKQRLIISYNCNVAILKLWNIMCKKLWHSMQVLNLNDNNIGKQMMAIRNYSKRQKALIKKLN